MAELDGGDFTKHGYLTTKSAFQEFYMGTEDIPIKYRVPAPDTAAEKNNFIMVDNVDLSSLLLEIHALGGDFMRDVKHNLQTLAGGGNDFYVMISNTSLIVTPVGPALTCCGGFGKEVYK